jgi:hypothetical protein
MKNRKQIDFFVKNKISGLNYIIGGSICTVTGDFKNGKHHGDTFYSPTENQKTSKDTWDGKKGDLIVAMVVPDDGSDDDTGSGDAKP